MLILTCRQSESISLQKTATDLAWVHVVECNERSVGLQLETGAPLRVYREKIIEVMNQEEKASEAEIVPQDIGQGMFYLEHDESVIVGNAEEIAKNTRVTISEIVTDRGLPKVRLGVEAPKDVHVYRAEVEYLLLKEALRSFGIQSDEDMHRPIIREHLSPFVRRNLFAPIERDHIREAPPIHPFIVRKILEKLLVIKQEEMINRHKRSEILAQVPQKDMVG